MRKVVWTDEARSELRSAITYIAKDSPPAARLVRQRLTHAVEQLAESPIGRSGRVKGTYEKTVRRTSHIVAYALSDQAITILHIIHAKRDWPEGAWPEEER